MSKKKDAKKDNKKKKANLRYGVHIQPIDMEDAQKSRFTLVRQGCDESYSESILFLPKKIDSLIKKIEKLGVHAVDVEVSPSKYVIRFTEDEKSSGGADLLYDVYVNNPSNHVFFIWAERYSEYPKSFNLIIDIAGADVSPTNEQLSKFILLENVINTNAELKVCSKYTDSVLDALKNGKKGKLKKLYQDKR